jgi:predicted RNase H-like HicB family nuclease
MQEELHQMVVRWSPEDEAFVVDVSKLPGCTSKGKTRTEAVEAAEQAVELWSRGAGAVGLPVTPVMPRCASATTASAVQQRTAFAFAEGYALALQHMCEGKTDRPQIVEEIRRLFDQKAHVPGLPVPEAGPELQA